MLNRLRSSRSLLACLLLCGSFAGCGGSSSETPPPLSPDPLNDPYRSNADFERKARSAKTESSDDAAAPEAPASPAEPAGQNPE
jgi:hypothetical protein